MLILSERLHAVTTYFDQLRTVRFQDTIEKKLPKRRKGLKLLPPPEEVSISQTDNSVYSREWLTEQQEFEPEVLEARQLMMDEETRALQVY